MPKEWAVKFARPDTDNLSAHFTRKRILIKLYGDVAQGQRYAVRAEQAGTFSYKTVLGALATVERWALVPKPD